MANPKTATPSKDRATFTPSFVVTAIIFPAVAAITTVGCYIFLDQSTLIQKPFISSTAIFSGIGVGAIVWIIGAWLYRPYISIKRATVNEYQHIRSMFTTLNAKLEVLSNSTVANQTVVRSLEAQRNYVQSYLQESQSALVSQNAPTTQTTSQNQGGFRWVNGFGYVYLWRALHRMQEDLLHIEETQRVIECAADDVVLISKISGIKNGATLIASLENAITELGNTQATNLQHALARSTIARARNTINVLRDDSLEAIFLSRKYLFMVTLTMSYLAYVLLCLTILSGIPVTAIVAAGVYYLVGAIVGLFARLSQDAKSRTVLQDHSLSGVRLLYLPMFSGVAGIGGVLLTALLSLSAVQAITSGLTVEQTVNTVSQAMLNLFDLSKFPSGILVAALFGLSPTLLTSRLKQQADVFRDALKEVEGQGKN
jgi:hypothetical protein